jgi:hypothetical protein
MKLTYEEYKQMANLMVLYMRRQEEETLGKFSSVWMPCVPND